MSDNPLLDLRLPIRWPDITPAHIGPAIEHLLVDARAAVGAIRDNPEPPTWANTLGALDAATEPLERAWSVVQHLQGARHTTELADAHDAAQPAVSAFYSGLPLDAELYARLQAYAATPEAQALTGARARYLSKTLDSFRRHGAELDPPGKARLEALDQELAALGSRFARNVLEETAAWSRHLPDAARLAGLPEGDLAMLASDARAHGLEGYRLSLQGPAAPAVLTHAHDRALREELWRAYHQRAVDGERANAGIIARMVALRREKAALLGYATWADLVLADRMAGSGASADAFLHDLERRARPAFAAETAELEAFAAREGAPTPLAPWDVSYMAERYRKATLDLDPEVLRAWFPAPRVLRGAFELATRLFGVTIAPAALPVWHPSVEAWSVTDEAGVLRGTFYTDLYPRPDKQGGAWMAPLVTGGPRADGGFDPHVGLLCANLTPPRQTPDGERPGLLLHRDVETVLHELGHLLHHLLTEVEVKGLAGTNVAWDFVELPSQLLENWAWEREGVDLLAAHVDTGAPLPDDLLARNRATRTFRAATALMRQLGFGRTDLDLHARWDPHTDPDVLAWARARREAFSPTPLPEGTSMLAGFTHLFGGAVAYSAGYYSYLWAAVLDADAFGRFLEAGVLDQPTGRALRDTIYARGDAEAPEALFEAFRGRPPSPVALLSRYGLSEASPAS